MKKTSVWLQAILASLLFLLAGVGLSTFLMPGIDWTNTYRPATLALLAGKSPFNVDIFFAAPWALIPLIPFALIPVEIGRGLLFVTGLATFAAIAYKTGAKPIAMVVFLISPPVLHCLLNSNIEWMALLGLVLPPWLGLIFLAIKPQIGMGIAIFYAVEAYRQGGWKQLTRTAAPVTGLLLLSMILYGPWPVRFSSTLALTRGYNQSLFPWSIPVGIGLLILAFLKKKKTLAAASSPMLSPYVLLHAWVGALTPLLTSDLATILAVIVLWALMLARVLHI
jgi:hypothetical protein